MWDPEIDKPAFEQMALKAILTFFSPKTTFLCCHLAPIDKTDVKETPISQLIIKMSLGIK